MTRDTLHSQSQCTPNSAMRSLRPRKCLLSWLWEHRQPLDLGWAHSCSARFASPLKCHWTCQATLGKRQWAPFALYCCQQPFKALEAISWVAQMGPEYPVLRSCLLHPWFLLFLLLKSQLLHTLLFIFHTNPAAFSFHQEWGSLW